MLKIRSIAILVSAVAAMALTACGSGDDNEPKGSDKTQTTAKTPTATPTKTPTGKPTKPTDDVKGVNVFEMGKARDTVISLCIQRLKKSSARESKSNMTKLRKSTTRLIDSFRGNPDEKFRRTPGAVNVSMRTRLEFVALVLNNRCAGGDAAKLGQRIDSALKKKPKST